MTEQMLFEGPVAKNITSRVRVWSRYRRRIVDNGREGDERQTLYVAPGSDSTQWIYLEGNGDPALVGYIADEQIGIADSAEEWVKQESWIISALGLDE